LVLGTFLDGMDKRDVEYASAFVPREVWSGTVVRQRPTAAVMQDMKRRKAKRGKG
jgi:hypothetical protein